MTFHQTLTECDTCSDTQTLEGTKEWAREFLLRMGWCLGTDGTASEGDAMCPKCVREAWIVQQESFERMAARELAR